MDGEDGQPGDPRDPSDDTQVPEEVVVPVEETLDLHTFRPRDVKDIVESYLEAAAEAGLAEVRLIHGRGIGVQREIVRATLARHPLVRRFADAPPERGGWGATVAELALPGGGGAARGSESD